MDPITAIGLVASVFQIASNCGRTLQSLTHLKARYKYAGATLDALASEVDQVKHNLMTLKGIFKDKDHSFSAMLTSRPDLQDTVGKTLRGCDEVFKLLSRDLQKISASSADSHQKLDFMRMTSFIKNERVFDDRLTQIRGHQTALTLLCQMLSMQSLSDITRLLRHQQAVLAEQSSLIKRTWSVVDFSDADTVVAESSSSRDALFNDRPIDPTAYPGSSSTPMARQSSQKLTVENLIDLDDEDDNTATVATSNGLAGHSPHLDDMRDLEPGYFKGKGKQEDDDTLKMVLDVEKRDSAQSISTLPSVIVESAEKIVVDATETVRAPSGSSASASRRESEQSITSLQELSSRDSVASSLPEAIMESDEYFPKVTHPHVYLPASEKDREASLESRLAEVLQSHDSNIQLQWAEDVLQFICSDAQERKRMMQRQVASPARSPTVASKMSTEAKKIVEVFVHKGDPKAMFLKARWIEKDQELALQDFLNALARRYLRAAYYIGNIYEQDRKDQRTAYGYFKQGSDSGDSASKARVGLAYLRGELGLKRHHEDAIRLILQAAATADSDSAESLFLLGMLQIPNFRQAFKIKDRILPIDIRSARENYFKAAKLGHSGAQLTVGKAYQSKDNELQLPVDAALSMHYLRLASRQGEAEADRCICCWFWFGHTTSNGNITVPENLELAFWYALRAARNGYTPAFCDVGFFYEHGKGVKQNYQRATDWYLKAIANGDKQAQKRYDNFINKMGVERKESRKDKEHGHGGLFRRATGMSGT